MKAITFTLDALFAIVIASIGVSILLFFHPYSPMPYIISSENSGQVLIALSEANMSSLANTSTIGTTYDILSQYNGSGETWTQFQSDSGNSGYNQYGPYKSMLSEIIPVNSVVTTGISADYGDIFFGAGSKLFSMNASGRSLWSQSEAYNIEGTPVIYAGKVIIWDSPNVTAVNAYNGSTIWTTNALSSTSPSAALKLYNGELILGAANGYVYTMNPDNGTVMSSVQLSSGYPTSIAIADGSIAVSGSGRNIYLFTNLEHLSQQVEIWASPLSAAVSKIAAMGQLLLYGDGIVANQTNINNTLFYSYASPSGITGVAYASPYAVYQGTKGVSVLTSIKSVLWYSNASSLFGTAMASSSPVIGGSEIYTLWSNGYIEAQSMSNGAMQWYTRIPYPNIYPNMTLAYGRLYVSAGNTILAYGACNVNPSESLLSSATSLFLFGDGSCGDYLINSVAPMSNYSLFYDGYALPSMRLANFNGKNSYAVTGGNFIPQGGLTMSVWLYPKGSTGKTQFPIDSNPGGTWRIGFSTNNSLILNPGTANTIDLSNTIQTNRWQSVIVTASNFGSNVVYDVYLNGTNINSGVISGESIQGINNLTFSNSTYAYNGTIANLQIYNYLLTSHQAEALYKSGIQGAPLSHINLLSWYPLDGSFNDFGPLSNAAYPFNVTYSRENYTPPGMTGSFEVSKSASMVPALNQSSDAENTYQIGLYSWK